MKSFSEMVCDTEWKLGRELQDREINFLRWVFDRYKKEQQEARENVTFT